MNQLPRRSVTSAFANSQLTQLTGKIAKGETFYASQKNLCKHILVDYGLQMADCGLKGPHGRAIRNKLGGDHGPGNTPAGDGFAGIAQVTQINDARITSFLYVDRGKTREARHGPHVSLRERLLIARVVQVFRVALELRRVVEPAPGPDLGQVKLRRRFQDDSPSILPRASREHIEFFQPVQRPARVPARGPPALPWTGSPP